MLRLQQLGLVLTFIGCALGAPCDNLPKSFQISPLATAKACTDLSKSAELIVRQPGFYGEWMLGCSGCSESTLPGRTVFLPTNEAWAAYFAKRGAATPGTPAFAELLRGHVLPSPLDVIEFFSNQVNWMDTLVPGASLGVRRLTGMQLALTPKGGPRSTSVVADITAAKSVVHIIDTVLTYTVTLQPSAHSPPPAVLSPWPPFNFPHSSPPLAASHSSPPPRSSPPPARSPPLKVSPPPKLKSPSPPPKAKSPSPPPKAKSPSPPPKAKSPSPPPKAKPPSPIKA